MDSSQLYNVACLEHLTMSIFSKLGLVAARQGAVSKMPLKFSGNLCSLNKLRLARFSSIFSSQEEAKVLKFQAKSEHFLSKSLFAKASALFPFKVISARVRTNCLLPSSRDVSSNPKISILQEVEVLIGTLELM
jgi:hypothetical protein